MTEQDKKEIFPITGQFNIPVIYPMKIIDKNTNIIKNLKLKPYIANQGNASNPSNGYYVHKILNPTDFINEHEELKVILENIIAIDYISDNYVNENEYKDGKISRHIVKTSPIVNNIFLLKPNLIIIKGNKDLAFKFRDSFNQIFKEKIKVDAPIVFNSWFLTWIIYNFSIDNKEIIENFFVDYMLDMAVQGEIQDLDGQYAQAKNSLDISRSLTVMLPLVYNKFPVDLKIGINVNNLTAVIKIYKNGRILLYQTQARPKFLDNFERVIHGVFIVKRIIDLYQYWNSLPYKNRIPPPEFIDNITREFKDRGHYITANVIDTKTIYEEERKRDDLLDE